MTSTFTALLWKRPTFRADADSLAAAGALFPLTERHLAAEVDAVEVPTTTDDPDCALAEVFVRLNHGSGDELPGYRGRSFSVGDVVVEGTVEDARGCRRPRAWICAPVGWTPLP